MKDDILAYIRDRGRVSFAELQRDIPRFTRPNGYTLTDPRGAILWTNLSAGACESIRTLQADGAIQATTCGPWPYLIDGLTLRLPLAKPGRTYKRPRWLPVTWSAI